MGIVEVNKVIQHDSMNDNLRNSLWNVLDQCIWSLDGFRFRYIGITRVSGNIIKFSRILWMDYFKYPIDKCSENPSDILRDISTYFFSASWYDVYNFLEFILTICEESVRSALRNSLNDILKRELSGFRLIEDKFSPITNKNEIEEISEAVNFPYTGCQTHLRKALEHMSNRENPDYRNSIKESVSAIESVAKEITGNKGAALKDALIQIEKSGKIHGALKSGFVSLYGYTSDADGIRHGAVGDSTNLTVADAKYFLVTCSAFVNYLIAKHADKPQ